MGVMGTKDGNVVVATEWKNGDLNTGCYTAIAPPSEDIYLQILNEFSSSTAKVEAAAQKVQASADEIQASLPAIHADAETAKAKAAEATAAAGEAAQSRDKAKEYQDAAQESAADALASAQAAGEAEDNVTAMQSNVQQMAGEVAADKADVASKAQTVTSLAQQVQETANEFPAVADAAKEAVTAEGTKQIGLVAAKGTEQVGAVNAAGATQTANAQAQADRAQQEADRAEQEADRAASIDAYTKSDSRQQFANAFTGEKSGSMVNLSDVEENTLLRKATVQGSTTEVLANPEAEKSPDNIASISGVNPTKATACGKNLLTYQPRSELNSGITADMKSDGSVVLNGSFTSIPSGGRTFLFVLMQNASFKPGNYYLSGCPAGGGGYTYKLTIALTAPDGSTRHAVDYGSGGAFTVNDGDILRISISCGDEIGTVNNLTFYPQIEEGQTATSYEPYSGTDYPLPTMEPLMSLPNGVCDEYDAVTGVETRRIEKLVVNGTENWKLLPEQCNDTSSFFYLNLSMGGSIVNCTHLIFRPVVSGSVTYTYDGIYGNAAGGSLYIRLNHSHNITTVDGLKEWLAAQYAAGTPLTVYYELKTPTTTQHDPATIPVVYPATTVYADDGDISIGYNRDSNKVVEQIVFDYTEQITALDARIAQLEIGGQ